MPVTIKLPESPARHRDPELQELLDKMSRCSGKEWYAVTHITVQLLAAVEDMPGHYQTIQYVKTMPEVKAYLYGALGAYRCSTI